MHYFECWGTFDATPFAALVDSRGLEDLIARVITPGRSAAVFRAAVGLRMVSLLISSNGDVHAIEIVNGPRSYSAKTRHNYDQSVQSLATLITRWLGSGAVPGFIETTLVCGADPRTAQSLVHECSTTYSGTTTSTVDSRDLKELIVGVLTSDARPYAWVHISDRDGLRSMESSVQLGTNLTLIARHTIWRVDVRSATVEQVAAMAAGWMMLDARHP